MMKKQVSLPIVVVIAVVLTAGGFFGGMQYQRMQRSAAFGGRNAAFFNGQSGPMGAQMGGRGNNGTNRPVAGEIQSVDAQGITVKMQDGSSKIVIVPDSAQINEATTSSKQSLSQGKRVVVFGSTNSDGSVTAQNIQLNTGNGPMMFGGNGGRGRE